MLIKKETGIFQAGTADVICIIKLPEGTFHACFFEEYPMPGPIQPISELSSIRLKSRMHHTQGAKTLDEAMEQVTDMRKKIILPDQNVLTEAALEVGDPVNVFFVPNWTNGNITLKQALFN